MFKELDIIALTSPIPRARVWNIPPGSPLAQDTWSHEGMKKGDIGTIAYVQDNVRAYEVESLEPRGRTVAIATIQLSQVRRATKEDIVNCRFRQKTADMATPAGTELKQES